MISLISVIIYFNYSTKLVITGVDLISDFIAAAAAAAEAQMIKGILIINNHGKPRLVKFYQSVVRYRYLVCLFNVFQHALFSSEIYVPLVMDCSCISSSCRIAIAYMYVCVCLSVCMHPLIK